MLSNLCDSAGHYSAGFVLVCDNCTAQELSLAADACTPDLAISSVDGQQVEASNLEAPLLLPAAVPGSTTMRQVAATNANMLPLPFTWASTSSATASAALSIKPSSGTFAANETIVFDVAFAPEATGSCSDCFQLLVDASWPQGSHQPTQVLQELQLRAEAAPHPAIIQPTVLRSPHAVVAGETVTQTMRVRNPSSAPAQVTIAGGTCDISAEPAGVCVPPHCDQDIAVKVYVASSEPVAHRLSCKIAHGRQQEITVAIPHIRQPQLRVECSKIEFGDVRLHDSASHTVVLHSSSATVVIPWSASIDGISGSASTGSAPSTCTLGSAHGEVEAGSAGSVRVELAARKGGTLRGRVVICSGGHQHHVLVCANIVAPQIRISAEQGSADLGTLYEGVPVQRTVQVRNIAVLPVTWRARPEAIVMPDARLGLQWHALEGSLQPGEVAELAYTVTAHCSGPVDALLVVEAEGAPEPTLLRITGCCSTLDVRCCVRGPAPIGEQCTSPWASAASAQPTPEAVGHDDCLVDFGTNIKLGEIWQCVVELHNVSGICAPVHFSLDRFGSDSAEAALIMAERAKTPAQQPQQQQDSGLPTLSAARAAVVPFTAAAGNSMIARRRLQVCFHSAMWALIQTVCWVWLH